MTKTIEDYSLEQNYPNPFNPSTKITFQIPESGLVSLKIYDVLGIEIATLLNEEKTLANMRLILMRLTYQAAFISILSDLEIL